MTEANFYSFACPECDQDNDPVEHAWSDGEEVTCIDCGTRLVFCVQDTGDDRGAYGSLEYAEDFW